MLNPEVIHCRNDKNKHVEMRVPQLHHFASPALVMHVFDIVW